jgi:hypothetical protein
MNEYRIIKPDKIDLKGYGKGEKERVIEGVSLIKVHCMNVWKYHYITTNIW